MSFFVVKNRIHLTRGDSAEFDLTIRDRVTGSVFIPGDGDRLTFTLKRFITDKDPVLTKTLGQGIRQEQDSCVLVFLPEDTRHLSCGRYIYEVKLVRGTGYTDTIIPARDFFLDDIATTGASLEEAARLLKEGGAEKVVGLVLASNAPMASVSNLD